MTATTTDAAAAAWGLAQRYGAQLDERVVLYAGTNHPGPQVRRALGNEVGAMPAMGRPWHKAQPGTAEHSALEELVEQQLCRLFRASWAEARLPSATTANLALYAAFCRPPRRRVLMATGPLHGGHASFLADGTPSLLGLEVVEIPFCLDGRTIDEDAAIALLERARPALLLLGATLALTVAHPLGLITHARRLGTVVAYDASHVVGLIASGDVPHPFDAGVEIIVASTYKSFGGPPGGIVLGREPAHADFLRPIVCPALTSNYDASRLLALSIACAEAAEFMPAYAAAMIATADRLHANLSEAGLTAAPRSETHGRTHQVFIELGAFATAKTAADDLERCNIVTGVARSPGSATSHGLRLGTQAIARKGYDASAVGLLGEIIAAVIRDGPSERWRHAATQLALRHRTLAFCFG